MRRVVIGANDHGQRLDRFLKKYLPKAPRSFLQKSIRTKKIKVNRKRAFGEQALSEGDILEIFIYDEVLKPYERDPRTKKTPAHPPIVFENESLILWNKPAGLLSHAAKPEDYGNNLVDQMVSYLIEKGEYVPRLEKSFTPALVNRLDRNTSGLVLGAKTARALRSLHEKLSFIEKRYWCILQGKVESLRVRGEISRVGTENRFTVSSREEKGKESITDFSLIKTHGDFSLVEAHLITGRTHQIRVHAGAMGHVMAGDPKYGDMVWNRKLAREYGLCRQALHARSLTFQRLEGELEELNGKTFTADPPEDFKRLLDTMGGIG